MYLFLIGKDTFYHSCRKMLALCNKYTIKYIPLFVLESSFIEDDYFAIIFFVHF